MRYKTRCKTGRTSAKVRATKLHRSFFAMNTPDPPHWTLNYHFAAFRTIWVHLGPFGCLTKLGAKQAELVQKFVTQSRVGIFRNERTRSTPLDPKIKILVRFLLFGCIWDRSVALRNLVQNGWNLCKSSCHEVASNFSQRTHPIHPIGP